MQMGRVSVGEGWGVRWSLDDLQCLGRGGLSKLELEQSVISLLES